MAELYRSILTSSAILQTQRRADPGDPGGGTGHCLTPSFLLPLYPCGLGAGPCTDGGCWSYSASPWPLWHLSKCGVKAPMGFQPPHAAAPGESQCCTKPILQTDRLWVCGVLLVSLPALAETRPEVPCLSLAPSWDTWGSPQHPNCPSSRC